jgi:G3E family GTPase
MQSPLLADIIYLEKIWCILDALHYSKVGKMMGRQKHQILIADELLINKTDLVTVDQVGQIREYIRNINPTAGITETLYGQGDFTVMEKADRNRPQAYMHQEELQGVESNRPDIKAGVFKSRRRIRFHDLQQLIQETVPSTLRIKGYVSLADGETALVHTVFQSIEIQRTDDIYGSTCLVFMGENFNLSAFSRNYRDLTV